ncbi:MAG: four helix bundle protein [Candidatus Zixiibacteriota bacterium]
MKAKVKSFEDLDVYQKLCELHLEVNKLSLSFPKFELHELGSQIRRSSNSIFANIAEAWNNKHINIYLGGINRAQGELQETRHQLHVAHRKRYLPEDTYRAYLERYSECGKMLRGLAQSLQKWKTAGKRL